MKFVVIIAIVATIGIMFVSLGTSEAFATDFKDKNYTPKWAKPQTEKETLYYCVEVLKEYWVLVDEFDWCNEFTEYFNKKYGALKTSESNEKYKDSTGYQPKWAKPQTEKETLDFCKTITRTADSASTDFKWCKEFTSYYNKKFNIPESKTMVTQPVNRQPTVAIYGGIETVHQNQYLVVVQICAGSDRFETPNIYLTSDLVTKKPILVKSIIGANSCTLVDYSIKANDPRSIDVGFSDTNESDSTKLTELEKEIAELKKLIVEKGLDKPSEKASTDAAADKKAADKKAADKKIADKKLADKKAADKKIADKKIADKKAADKKAAEAKKD